MRARFLLAIGLLVLGLGRALAEPSSSWSSAKVAGYIRDPVCRPTFIVAHRAKGFGLPEDSRAAVQAAIGAGVPIIEIDIRRSADGRLVVLHDPTLDRTTSMKGDVKDFTAAELRGALLANGETLPTFEEVYALSRGRAVLDLRFHVDAIEQTARWIAENGSFDDVIFFAISDDLTSTAASMRKLYPSMIVMAKAQTWADAERVNALFERPPEVLHPDASDPEFDHRLHANGIKVFRNLLDPETADLSEATNLAEFLGKRVDFLQTDQPMLILRELHGIEPWVEGERRTSNAGVAEARSSSRRPTGVAGHAAGTTTP